MIDSSTKTTRPKLPHSFLLYEEVGRMGSPQG